MNLFKKKKEKIKKSNSKLKNISLSFFLFDFEKNEEENFFTFLISFLIRCFRFIIRVKNFYHRKS
jgi:hypothetical protein